MADRRLYVGVLMVLTIITVSITPVRGALDDACSVDDNCTDVNAVCTDSLCACTASQYMDNGGNCTDKIAVDGTCPDPLPTNPNTNPCLDGNAACSIAGGTCTCNTGYRGSSVNCVLIDCDSTINTITNGNATAPSSTVYGSNATVTCDEGYESPSPDQVTCQANETWSSSMCTAIDCSSPPSDIVTSGTATLTSGSTIFESTATVTCDEGYITSTTDITCQDNGMWSTAICTIKNCSSDLSNSVSLGVADLTTPGSTTYGSTANVTCDEGHDSSTTVITCLADGNWQTAQCTLKNCSSDPSSSVTSGTAAPTTEGSITFQSTANVNCDEGHVTSTAVITCKADGTWSTAICDKIKCNSDPSNSVTLGTAALTTQGSIAFQSTANVNCDEGHETSTAVIVCQADGTWSTAICDKINCSSDLSNSVSLGAAVLTTPGSTTYGSTANVNCNEGHDTSTTVITCQADGNWQTAECTIRNCTSDPSSSVTSGTAAPTTEGSITFQSTANVNCDDGHETSTAVIVCQADGTWSTAICDKINCSSDLSNSVTLGAAVLTTPGSTTYGSTANVNCNEGHDTSTTVITCQVDGNWQTAECTIKDCGPIPSSAVTAGSATASSGTTTYQSTAAVTCDTGYETQTNQITCQPNGQWSTSVCTIKNCGPIPFSAVTDGTATSSSGTTTYQSTAAVTCDTGYETQTNQITCQPNGQWSTSVCTIKNCGPIPSSAVTDGTATASSGTTTYQSTAAVTCDTGYETQTNQITCQPNGQWSTSVCTIKNCGPIPSSAVTDGTATASSGTTTYQSTAAVTCDTGYETQTNQITCQPNGQWSTSVCTIKNCGPIPSSAVTYGTATASSGTTTYQSTAAVMCDTGYETQTNQITCQPNGQWSTSVCTIKNCGLIPLSAVTAGSATLTSGTTYLSTADVTCSTGYETSTTQITCQADGQWSTSVCTIIRNPLGANCLDPLDLNVSPGELCIVTYAECLKSNSGSQEFTCQCVTGFYDDNGNTAAGSCRSVSELAAQNVKFSSITTSSMTVTWTPPTGKQNFVSGYVVGWRREGGSTDLGTSDTLYSTSYTINPGNLVSGRAYTVTVTSRNTVNYTSTVQTTTIQTEQALKPQTPGSINTQSSNLDARDQRINVVWSPPNGYVLRYETGLFEGDTQLGTTFTSSTNNVIVEYNEMKNGYRYNISITAVSEMFNGRNVVKSDTYTEEIKTVVQAPSAPSSVRCYTSTDKSLTIQWNVPTTPNGDLIDYMVYTYDYDTSALLKSERTGDLHLEYEITSLQPGSYYYFKVSTFNEKYESQKTRLNVTYCSTKASSSDPPNNFNVQNIQSRSFEVTWTKPTNTFGELLGYILQVRTESDSNCVKQLIRRCSDCTGSFMTTALENMCDSSVSLEESVLKTDIDSDATQSYTVTGLNPDVVYSTSVTAVNTEGRGKYAETTIQTEEEVPQKPYGVTITDITTTSCTVTWSIDGPRPGNTTYGIIADPVSPAAYGNKQLEGFGKRSQVLDGLQEYWYYNVTIMASTSKGNNNSDSEQFRTLPAAPGAVDAFEVLTAPGGDYTKMKVQWKIPTILERNSEIASFTFVHNTSTNVSMPISVNDDSNYLYVVDLDVTPEDTYEFKVYATNIGTKKGAETPRIIKAPAGIPKNEFEDVGNNVVIQETAVSTQTSLDIVLNADFFYQTLYGDIVLTGVIVCARDKCTENDMGESMTKNEFETLDNWKDASQNGYTKYRATNETWQQTLQPITNRRRRQVQGTQKFVIGNEVCDETKNNQYCNGPLQPESSYIVHVVICTNGGCLVSNEYGPFVTQAVPPDEGDNIIIIVVAVVVSVVVIGIVVVVAFIVVRRRKSPGEPMRRLDERISSTLVEDPTTSAIEKSRPIKLSEFEAKLAVLHKDSNLLFSSAYEDLRTVSPKHSQEAANREENRSKNRYINILPFDHSRVKLSSNGEDDSNDYINGNYLPGYRSPREYIGCQGPIPGTIDDFWRMTWEQNVSIIVMLTLCKEGQKVKCEQYWPDEYLPDEAGQAKQYGDVVVEVTSTSTIQTYVMRIFKITNNGKSRTIKHFHFLSWLDFQANVKHDIILDFITHVRSHVQPPDTAGPMIVHCSAGVGRTGTYICLDHLMQYIEEQDLDASVDIFNMVLKLRDNRPLMVQTEQQFVFIHDGVKELLDRKRRNTENIYENQGFSQDGGDDIYQNTQQSLYENVQMKTEL